MNQVTLFLVKPHPPEAILDRQTPVPEAYRYDWEPISLKYLAYCLSRAFADRVHVRIWHLMDRHDDEQFIKQILESPPSIVAFSETDILVNQVNALAARIKSVCPGAWTVVGGKQTSLLRAGDHFPFGYVDYALRGDGVAALKQLVRHRLSNTLPVCLPGLVGVDDRGLVAETPVENPRMEIASFDGPGIRSMPVENRSMAEYLDSRQYYPSIRPEEPRTAPILIGTGCPHTCSVCQSPVEYAGSGSGVILRNNADIAREIIWLRERHGVTNFFSLESSMNLSNLRGLYGELSSFGVDSLSLSGFVRAADVVHAHRNGLLSHLADRGMRVLSIGLDVPSSAKGDIYNKSFTFQEQMECLTICEELGIIVLATAIIGPDQDRADLIEQLRLLFGLPVAEVDVRLAIALRNTAYFRTMEKHLLLHPDRDVAYYDCQNYRYQTICIPGMVTPEETYELVSRFHDTYFTGRQHAEYVHRMMRNHSDTKPFFERQIRNRAESGRRPSVGFEGRAEICAVNINTSGGSVNKNGEAA